MIDISRALRHPLDDTRWVSKFLIGGLIGIVPILQFALFGWGIRHLQQVSRGQDNPLPEWSDLGDKFGLGLKLFIVLFVLLLPATVLNLIVTSVVGVAAASADEDTIGGVVAVSVIVGLLAFVYGLLVALLSPAISIQMARTESIGACLRIGDLLAIIRSNTRDYLVVLLIPLALGFAFGVVFAALNIIPCLGQIAGLVLFLAFFVYAQVLSAHLCGQFVAGESGQITQAPVGSAI